MRRPRPPLIRAPTIPESDSCSDDFKTPIAQNLSAIVAASTAGDELCTRREFDAALDQFNEALARSDMICKGKEEWMDSALRQLVCVFSSDLNEKPVLVLADI